MTDIAAIHGHSTHPSGKKRESWTERLFPSVLIACSVTWLLILLIKFPGTGDYVGPDNDDALRLVEVRDLLAGQGWFDLMQYRLGTGGVLMHWSRLIDLPIAALIRFFSLFTTPASAEVLALAVWPMSLILPLYLAIGAGARNIGGKAAMQMALVFAILLVLVTNRFLPGGIDHHNVQLVLAATIVAMLVDPSGSSRGHALAGAAAALAIAIGAETMPFIAVCCLCVALRWAICGNAWRPAARAFSLALTVTISLAFFLGVPPQRWSVVTCDSLSLGFYALASIGGSLLFLSATFTRTAGLKTRLAVLAANGAAVLGSALVIAPQCLGNPLSDLDPLVVDLWLNGVSEAHSFMTRLRLLPESIGYFYIPGLLALVVCCIRIIRDDRRAIHLTLLALVASCYVVALIQVRGALFANMLSIFPLSLLVAELRTRHERRPGNIPSMLAYIGAGLVSLPSVWLGAGIAAEKIRGNTVQTETAENSCQSKEAFSQLSELPAGLVVVPADSGARMLRFTHHRTLTGPYHRNQAGILTEIHIGISSPGEALAFVRDAGVSAIGFCPGDGMTRKLMMASPDGLYSQLGRGEIPSWLTPLPADSHSGIRVYIVKPPES